jgi:hypothetical protein
LKKTAITIHEKWSILAGDCIQIALVCGTIGIALKFITFFNQWVYFPTFPNIIDSAFLITAVLYLVWAARKRIHKNEMYSISQIHMQANVEIEEPNTMPEITVQ